MSHQWVYSGHANPSTLITSIYCSKVVPKVPTLYIWTVKTRNGEEKTLGHHSVNDFTHAEDVKAINYALSINAMLQEKEYNKYLQITRSN